jgi:hypothetical protein
LRFYKSYLEKHRFDFTSNDSEWDDNLLTEVTDTIDLLEKSMSDAEDAPYIPDANLAS